MVAFAFPFLALAASTDLIQNGSFETNGGANSNVLPGWTIVDEQGGSGTWLAQRGTTGPVTPDFNCGITDVQPPPDGMFAAMSTQSAAGSHVLYQDIAIPAGSAPVLSFQYFIHNAAGSFFAPDSLSFQTNPNQQFRVDLIDPASNPFTLNVLQNVLLVGPGNPHTFGYETQTATLSGFGGRTVRLRFVEVDNVACFNVGVDNVRLDTGASNPAPAIIQFTIDPETVPFAGASTLTWSTQNATSVEIDHGIGAVPLSGSRDVSLQDFTTFTLTATGPGGSAHRSVAIFVRSPGPSIRFSAEPSFIQRGQPSTLTWTTMDATGVSIDNTVGSVAASGSLIVTPSTTTEYTLSAKGSGATSTARATVFVDPGDVPIVSVTSFPSGIVQIAGGSAGAVDQFALTNLGRVATTITLGQNGDFFSQSPASFTLAAGATQIVSITTTAQPAGKFEGASLPAGAGVPVDLRIPVRLFIAIAPTGTVAPTTAVARTEIAAPPNQNPSGSVSFTNRGTGTLQGIAISDAAWLIPQSDVVTIGPGETKPVTFTTNRTLRADAASPGGAAIATLTLAYVDLAPSSARFKVPEGGGGSTSTISVTIVDVVKPGATPAAPPPLSPGEVAFFVPGLFQRTGSAGDLFVSVIGSSIADLRLYLAAPGMFPVLGSLDQLAPNAGLALLSVLQSVFASSAPTGTVQARSANLSRVALAALQTITSGSGGAFITALPTFRSDRSAVPGEMVYLAGVEKSTARFTNVFIQEVAGLPATARIEFLDSSGNLVSSRQSESIEAFSLLSLPDVVPAPATSARVTNTSPGAARIVAYALVTDAITKDAWTVVGSQLLAAASTEQITAVVPSPVTAGTTANTVYVLNPDAAPLEITIDRRPNPVRRRAVRSGGGPALASTMTIGPGQTVSLPIGFSNGYLRVMGARPFVLTARSMSAVPGREGFFGSALPVFSTSAALTAGQSHRFGGVDDAGRAAIAASTPGTYRSNLGLIESSGQPVVVRLTLRYSFSAGIKTSAEGLSSLSVPVAANGFVILNEISRAVIGSSRDGYGDLRNMQLDVEVVSGAGRVSPFVQTIENGSTDSAIRIQ